MALTFTELLEEYDPANISVYTSVGSIAPAANRGLVGFFYSTGTNIATPPITGGGVTWTLLGANSRGAGMLYVAYALTGASPGSGAVTVDVTGNAGTACFFHVTEIGGCDLTDFIGLFDDATETAAGGTPSIAFGGTTAADSGVLAAVATLGNNTQAPPTGYTELADIPGTSPAAAMEVAYHASPGAVTGATWQATSAGATSQIGLEILAAAAPPSALSPPPRGHYSRFPHVRT